MPCACRVGRSLAPISGACRSLFRPNTKSHTDSIPDHAILDHFDSIRKTHISFPSSSFLLPTADRRVLCFSLRLRLTIATRQVATAWALALALLWFWLLPFFVAPSRTVTASCCSSFIFLFFLGLYLFDLFFRLNLLRYSLHPDTLGSPSQSNALYLFFSFSSLLLSSAFPSRTSSFPDLCLRPNKVQPSIFGHAAGSKQWSPPKRHVGATD